MSMTIPFKASYEFSEVEEKWLKQWMDKNLFSVNKDLTNGRETFSVALPPPNVTGDLHMGHALSGTIQDVLIRYHRMLGKDVHWQIGSDHAGIGTQIVVEKQLKKEEHIKKEDLGREKFIERVQAWKEISGNKIIEQMKRLGFSPDYDRTRYTMDSEYQEAVLDAFKKYHENGLIYKGKRLSNWCPKCQTSLSDLEIDENSKKKQLFEIDYLLTEEIAGLKALTVATTRPETMFGDTAVAINPNDERYTALINELKTNPEKIKAKIPFTNKEIPVVLDEHVKLDFGTGALKVTPAHDFNDNEIGKRHNLKEENTFDKHACLLSENSDPELNLDYLGENSNKLSKLIPSQFQGLERYDARKNVVEELETLGQLKEIKEYESTENLHDRCGTEIEPALSDQWYLAMKDLANRALARVSPKEDNPYKDKYSENEKTSFIPERYTDTFKAWLENIQDWCISRQIWWGHQIPLEGETDVLDTWFSSALWPYTAMADDKTVLKKYYPTTILATAREIINLWVSRMIFSSDYFRNEKAFEKVLIHPVVQTPDGKRMSKSKGNAIDPLDLVAKYGADASRMWYAQVGIYGTQDVKFPGKSNKSKEDPKKKVWESDVFEKYKRFNNKLYNASKFLFMNLVEDPSFKANNKFKAKAISSLDQAKLTIADKWILNKINTVLEEVETAFANYDISKAQDLIYSFAWNDFCDWYIELSKIQDNTEEKNQILFYILNSCLRGLQPFIPFITEEIWQTIIDYVDFSELEAASIFTDAYGEQEYQAIAFTAYPKAQELSFKETNENEIMNFATDFIAKIRNARQSLNIAWTENLNIIIEDESSETKSKMSLIEDYIKGLAKINSIKISSDSPEKPISSFIIDKTKVHIPLKGLVDIDKLKESLTKKIEKVEKVKSGLEGRLKSPNFTEKAPPEKVAEVKEELRLLNEEITLYAEELKNLSDS